MTVNLWLVGEGDELRAWSSMVSSGGYKRI